MHDLWAKYQILQQEPLLALSQMSAAEYMFLRKMAAGVFRRVAPIGPIDPRTAN